MSINIERSLKERFAAPPVEDHKRRIIFWQDPDGEFDRQVDELSIDGVKIIKLNGKNSFYVKMLLSETDIEGDYLVYDPLTYADIRDDWLLDIKLYSEEFRADLHSIRMDELNMPNNAQLRKAMKAYSKFFDNRERVARLASFKSRYDSVGQLHIDIMAVLAGAEANNAASVIKAILLSWLDNESNEAIASIRKFGNEAVMWEMISRYTGYIYSENASLTSLAEHILMTALSVTMNTAHLVKFDKLISSSHGQRCYDLVNEWLHSDKDDELYTIARIVEYELNLEEHFDKLEIEALLDSECFPCINECILRKYMTEISDSIIKAEDIVRAVEKRRTLKWYKRVRHYFDGLLQVAKMQQFYQSNISGFHIAEYGKLWCEYCDNYCKMDHYYRSFHVSFAASLRESSTVLEDMYKNVADYVEKLYKNWYLSTLGTAWTSLISDEIVKDTRLFDICNQADFYRCYVKSHLANGSRVYVIISDALRYEVGKQLAEELLKETKGSAKLSSMQAVFPSATKFGMAALLPHYKLQLTDECKVLCDGRSTDGLENRGKLLESVHSGNVAITYGTLRDMKQAERRERVKNAQVVYIYHNTIDAVGDKALTEDNVFDACEQAVTEIKNLVRLIANDMSGTNIIITADHGFLYSRKPLDELDKAEKSLISGNIVELDRRYVIADGDCSAEHMLKLPMKHMNSELVGFTPADYIRIKKQGGGMNYVHGGISLQECVVSVIEYKNIRSGSKKFVDAGRVELMLISQSRKISNSIFSLDFYQKDAVGGKLSAATYEVYMADASGKPVSDKKMIIADKTSNNDSERLFKVGFALKSIEFKKTDAYYLTIAEKDSGNVIDRVEFTIDIAFINDFDF